MSDLETLNRIATALRDPEAWATRCKRCEAREHVKLGSWRRDGYAVLHRWILGGRTECGLGRRR